MSHLLNKYEKTALISQRAEDISAGSPITVKNPETDNPIEIAKMELDAGTIPYKIVRAFPDGSIQVINVKDLLF